MSFMVIKAVLPVSVALFYINWPLIGHSQFSWYTIVGLIIILGALASYKFATFEKTEYKLGCCSTQIPCLENLGWFGNKIDPNSIN